MGNAELDGMPLPKMAPSAMDSVRDRDHARDVLTAYYHPDIRHDCDPRVYPDREVRIGRGVHLVVSVDNGTIISVGDHVPAPLGDASPVLTPLRRPKRRAHGGAGTRTPTSIAELIDRIKKVAGKDAVQRTTSHYVVRVKGAAPIGIAANTGDWRSILNTVKTLRYYGIDVTRDV